MLITDNRVHGNSELKIRNRKIDKTDNVKFLRIMLDDTLSFKAHISYISLKLSRSIGVINRVSYLVPFPQLRNLYFALVYPLLTYGVTVWGKASVGGESKMQSIQKRAINTITKYLHNPAPEINRLLNIDSIHAFFTAVKLYKMLKQDSHMFLRDRLMNIQVNHNYSTRFQSRSCLTIPLFKKTKCLASFAYQSVHVWNKLPLELRAYDSIATFKRELKRHLTVNQRTIL